MAAVAIGLCACAPRQTQLPVAPPTAPVETPAEPAPPPAPPPTKPTTAVPAAVARVVVLDPHNPQQDEDRIKLALAKNSHESLKPADVGYYMDVLHGRLKQVAGKDYGVVRRGDYVVLDMSFESGFDKGSAQLDSSVRDVLVPLSKVLMEFRLTLVSVHVRADDSAVQPVKPGLAERRAQAFARVLVDAGIAGKRVVIAGVDSNGQAETNAPTERHLRVDVQVEPIVRVSVNEH